MDRATIIPWLRDIAGRSWAASRVAAARAGAVAPAWAWSRKGRLAAGGLAAALLAGLSLTASSAVVSPGRASALAVAQLTGPELSEAALTRVKGRLTSSQLAVAARHDPAAQLTPTVVYGGLTPGWESFTLQGKPPLAASTVDGLRAQQLNASIPAVKGAIVPARPFVLTTGGEMRRRALRCLTQAVYYEAALEPTPGQEGVAQVVLNRMRDPNYPNTVCGVVYQGAERVTGCQFSFTCDGSLARAPVPWAWERARRVAERALNGYVAARVGTATHYHADYVYAWWSPTVLKLTQVGAHIFYRWKGAAGELSALVQRYAGREPSIDEARFARPRLVLPRGDEATAEALVEAGVVESSRTVEINGQTRVVGVVSLGGRRLPTRDEVAAINARLRESEASREDPARPAPAGVTPMAVNEVGRPPPAAESGEEED
ncbi:MAG TPA: cell wall hydrolase [Caulobacteraceae bacterium]|jgi:hypothetical protein